jgi:hypothetical protein
VSTGNGGGNGPFVGQNQQIIIVDEVTNIAPLYYKRSDSGWTESLRAEVIGATATAYTWDLSQAPDAGSVSGQNAQRLQLTWNSFTPWGYHTAGLGVTATLSGGGTLSTSAAILVACGAPYTPIDPQGEPHWPLD